MKKYILCFVILIILFNFLLLLACSFPSSWIEKNVLESSEILLEQGNYYTILPIKNVIINNYTDSIMINTAYSIDNKKPITSYMSARKNYKDGLTKEIIPDTQGELISINNLENYDPVGELNEFLDGKIMTSVEYARYWHGYLILLRPMQLFFNITEIRNFMLGIFIILFIYFLYLIKKEFGISKMIIFAIALMGVDYFCVPFNLESTPVFLIMMISSIFLLKRLDKIKDFNLFLFVIGAITSFMDFLTVPLITLAIPLCIEILHKQKNEQINYKQYIKLIIKSSILWGIGYGATWTIKWILFDCIYQKGLIYSAINQILYRTQSRNSEAEYTISQALGMFSLYAFIIISLICIGYGIKMITNIKANSREIKNSLNHMFPFAIIAIMPYLWYIVTINHTVRHIVFVYRHMLIFLLGIMICIDEVFKKK